MLTYYNLCVAMLRDYTADIVRSRFEQLPLGFFSAVGCTAAEQWLFSSNDKLEAVVSFVVHSVIQISFPLYPFVSNGLLRVVSTGGWLVARSRVHSTVKQAFAGTQKEMEKMMEELKKKVDAKLQWLFDSIFKMALDRTRAKIAINVGDSIAKAKYIISHADEALSTTIGELLDKISIPSAPEVDGQMRAALIEYSLFDSPAPSSIKIPLPKSAVRPADWRTNPAWKDKRLLELRARGFPHAQAAAKMHLDEFATPGNTPESSIHASIRPCPVAVRAALICKLPRQKLEELKERLLERLEKPFDNNKSSLADLRSRRDDIDDLVLCNNLIQNHGLASHAAQKEQLEIRRKYKYPYDDVSAAAEEKGSSANSGTSGGDDSSSWETYSSTDGTDSLATTDDPAYDFFFFPRSKGFVEWCDLAVDEPLAATQINRGHFRFVLPVGGFCILNLTNKKGKEVKSLFVDGSNPRLVQSAAGLYRTIPGGDDVFYVVNKEKKCISHFAAEGILSELAVQIGLDPARDEFLVLLQSLISFCSTTSCLKITRSTSILDIIVGLSMNLRLYFANEEKKEELTRRFNVALSSLRIDRGRPADAASLISAFLGWLNPEMAKVFRTSMIINLANRPEAQTEYYKSLMQSFNEQPNYIKVDFQTGQLTVSEMPNKKLFLLLNTMMTLWEPFEFDTEGIEDDDETELMDEPVTLQLSSKTIKDKIDSTILPFFEKKCIENAKFRDFITLAQSNQQDPAIREAVDKYLMDTDQRAQDRFAFRPNALRPYGLEGTLEELWKRARDKKKVEWADTDGSAAKRFAPADFRVGIGMSKKHEYERETLESRLKKPPKEADVDRLYDEYKNTLEFARIEGDNKIVLKNEMKKFGTLAYLTTFLKEDINRKLLQNHHTENAQKVLKKHYKRSFDKEYTKLLVDDRVIEPPKDVDAGRAASSLMDNMTRGSSLNFVPKMSSLVQYAMTPSAFLGSLSSAEFKKSHSSSEKKSSFKSGVKGNQSSDFDVAKRDDRENDEEEEEDVEGMVDQIMDEDEEDRQNTARVSAQFHVRAGGKGAREGLAGFSKTKITDIPSVGTATRNGMTTRCCAVIVCNRKMIGVPLELFVRDTKQTTSVALINAIREDPNVKVTFTSNDVVREGVCVAKGSVPFHSAIFAGTVAGMVYLDPPGLPELKYLPASSKTPTNSTELPALFASAVPHVVTVYSSTSEHVSVHNAPTSPGDCGTPFVCEGKVIGFHVGASQTGSMKAAYAIRAVMNPESVDVNMQLEGMVNINLSKLAEFFDVSKKFSEAPVHAGSCPERVRFPAPFDRVAAFGNVVCEEPLAFNFCDEEGSLYNLPPNIVTIAAEEANVAKQSVPIPAGVLEEYNKKMEMVGELFKQTITRMGYVPAFPRAGEVTAEARKKIWLDVSLFLAKDTSAGFLFETFGINPVGGKSKSLFFEAMMRHPNAVKLVGDYVKYVDDLYLSFQKSAKPEEVSRFPMMIFGKSEPVKKKKLLEVRHRVIKDPFFPISVIQAGLSFHMRPNESHKDSLSNFIKMHIENAKLNPPQSSIAFVNVDTIMRDCSFNAVDKTTQVRSGGAHNAVTKKPILVDDVAPGWLVGCDLLDECRKISEILTDKMDCVSLDVSAWDRSLCSELVLPVFKMLFLGDEKIAKIYVRGLCQDSLFFAQGRVFQAKGFSWCSGNLFTLSANTIIHFCMQRCVLRNISSKSSWSLAQGDDGVLAFYDTIEDLESKVKFEYKVFGFELKEALVQKGRFEFCKLLVSRQRVFANIASILKKMVARGKITVDFIPPLARVCKYTADEIEECVGIVGKDSEYADLVRRAFQQGVVLTAPRTIDVTDVDPFGLKSV